MLFHTTNYSNTAKWLYIFDSYKKEILTIKAQEP